MFKKIFLAYDTSEGSQKALHWALEWASLFGASVDIVTVIDDQLSSYIAADQLSKIVEKTQQKIDEQWGALKKRFPHQDAVCVNIKVEWGKPASQLLKMAGSDYDLLIAGSRGLTGLSHVSLGSVAAQLVRQSPVPVLIVKQDYPSHISPLLLPLDFSEASEELLLLASQLAPVFKSHVDLLHVVTVPDLYKFSNDSDALMPVFDLKLLEDSAKKNLGTLCDKHGFLKHAHKHVVTGIVNQEIVAQSKKLGSHLIVMSTHGHSGLAHWLLGSTTESVARYGDTSVLTFSPKHIKEKRQDLVGQVKEGSVLF